jgi:sulfate transport system substrate-binding protein
MWNISGTVRRKASAFIFLTGLTASVAPAGQTVLLNVSFDVSRQLFEEINPAFVEQWKAQTGENLAISQSHGGSSKQARAVIDGLDADVVTLNQVTDIDAIAAKGGLIAADWRARFPNHSAPYLSTIVFLVRQGNPKTIRDWDDLIKPGVSVVVPNPKTSGNGRYSYLGAYAFALKKFNNDDAKTREFVGALFKNVPVLDNGGRGATVTFVQRGIGDVLLTFEAEALLMAKESGMDKLQIVTPPQSIEAEMPVAVVDKFARRHGTEKAAQAYLEFLYSEEAQEIIARNFYRPRSETAAAKYAGQFGKLTLFTVDDVFGGWANAQKVHFADGGVYDQILKPKN